MKYFTIQLLKQNTLVYYKPHSLNLKMKNIQIAVTNLNFLLNKLNLCC